jgi:probable F420-dependent oxidoreductase
MKIGVLFNTDRLDGEDFIRYATRLDDLGFESLWLPELFTRDPFAAAGYLLAETQQIRLATGIANIYGRDPLAMVASACTLQDLSGGRFLLGLGVSNAALNRSRGHEWQSPTVKLREYLQAMGSVRLTAPQPDVPVHVAAHGPKMLATVAELAAGANTYLMPLEHVAVARRILGGHAELNTMLFCLLDEDPASARATARKAISFYIGLDYYHRAWRTFGFDDGDFANGGSDRLIDAVVAWGSLEGVRGRIAQQFSAGASRVVVIPLGAGLGGQPDWRLLEALRDPAA